MSLEAIRMNNPYFISDDDRYSYAEDLPDPSEFAEGVTGSSDVSINEPPSTEAMSVFFALIDGEPTIEIAPRRELRNGIQFRIQGSFNSGYRFIRPLPVNLTYILKDHTWLISDDLFDEYGVGETVRQARRDYVSGLISYYETLEEWATNENPPTQQQLVQLREYFIKE